MGYGNRFNQRRCCAGSYWIHSNQRFRRLHCCCARLRLRGWRVRQDTFDNRRLLVRRFLAAACYGDRVFDLIGHLVTGVHIVQARVVVLQAFQLVVRRFQRFVRNQHHADALLEFYFGNLGALLVQQETRHFHRHLRPYSSRVFLDRLFLNNAQNLQCAAFGVAHMARATATWARNGGAFAQSRAQALAAHFHQAKFADGAKLHAGTVLAQRVAQTVFHVAAVA